MIYELKLKRKAPKSHSKLISIKEIEVATTRGIILKTSSDLLLIKLVMLGIKLANFYSQRIKRNM